MSVFSQDRLHVRTVADASRRALTPGELAWIAALPCAALTAAAVVLLGPPLGHGLLAPSGEGLWPRAAWFVNGSPEPVKHARIALALLGPLLLAGVVLVGARRPPRLAPSTARALVTASQALLWAGLVAATIGQRHIVTGHNVPAIWRIFSVPAFVVAGALAAGLAAALRTPALSRRLTRPPAPSRRLAAACLFVATVATVVWLLPALNTEHTAVRSAFPDLPPWAMGDTYAVLDGRTPLVNYHAVYGQLWGYLAAVPMALLDDTIGVFTSAMVLASALAMLAVYTIVRRLVRDPLLALVLYVPWLATGLFEIAAPGLGWRVSNVSVFSLWPMRYAGPWLLAWLTLRHLDGAKPRRTWILGLVGGLVAINNLEFGIAALAATLVALACAPERRSRGALGRLAASVTAGLLGAALLVTLLTLARSGSLPRPGLLFELPRVFGSLGLVALPLAPLGFHLVIYAVFAAALATAAVRLVRGDGDAPLTAMTAWSGVFGLGCAGYFAGRSDPLKLAALFPAAGFALTLLLIMAVRALAGRPRLPSLAEAALLVGFGLTVCSLAQVQAPWREIERLHAGGAPPVYEAAIERRFVASLTSPGDHVAIVLPIGHRIAYDLGLVNVSPYATIEEIVTRAQWRALFDAMRDEGAHQLFIMEEILVDAHRQLLAEAGFVRRAQADPMTLWEDAGGG